MFACSCVPATEAASTGAAQSAEAQAETAAAGQEETLLLRFVSEHLVTSDGGVRTNYLDPAPNADWATGEEVLSESMGLWMLYAAKTGDQASFERSLAFVKERLDMGVLLSYRYSPESGAYPVNAFLDDLRVIRALLLAQEAFGGQYETTALSYADRLYRTNVKENRVYDFYDERYGGTNDFVTLCYLDLDTLNMLAARDEKWWPVLETMRAVAEGGYLGDRFPMYARSYDYASETYSSQSIDTVQSLLTMLSLSQVGACPRASVDWIRQRVAKGTLYGAYDLNGANIGQTESTAVYAICAMIGQSEQDGELYRLSIARMERFQVLDQTSEVYGAFANARTLELYAFDNLMALLAYRA